MTCMTPRAFALETISLLKPLSCQPIAAASEAGTPLAADALDRAGADARRRRLRGGGRDDARGRRGLRRASRRGRARGQLEDGAGEQHAFGSRPFIAAIARRRRPRRREAGQRVARRAPCSRPWAAGAAVARCGGGRGGAAPAAGARHEAGLLRAAALGGGRDLDRAAEDDAATLGQAVVRGDRAGREVVRRRDRPQRLARLHDVRRPPRLRRGEERRERWRRMRRGSGGRAHRVVLLGVDGLAPDSRPSQVDRCATATATAPCTPYCDGMDAAST